MNMEAGEPEIAEKHRSRQASFFVGLGCAALAGVFADASIAAISTGASSETLSAVIDGAFAVVGTVLAVREWPRAFRRAT